MTDNKGDAQQRFSQILSIKYNNAQFLVPLFLSDGCWQKQFKFVFFNSVFVFLVERALATRDS